MNPDNAVLAQSEVLLLEDETLLRKRLTAFLEAEGAEVVAVDTVEKARGALRDWSFDFALVDIQLPDGEGLDLLREGLVPETTVAVVMTAEGGVRRAVEAMRLGAADFLTKPFDEEELPLIFARSKNLGQATRLREFRQQANEQAGDELFFGPSMRQIQAQLDRILEADARLGARLPPVLICGHTGTGKSTLARWLHRQGPRADRDLVEINCSTLPDTLAESELFGHERGAFTDARNSRMGLFEAAHQATLFLDEVPSLSPAVQAKLLTAIEDGKIRRVGGNKDIVVDVRLIAATNADLEQLVKEGSFREDLYHRLNLLKLRMPDLKDRGNDIVALANHILRRLAGRYRAAVSTIPTSQHSFLLHYDWPGNVRELTHELERQLVWGGGEHLDFSHLPSAEESARPAPPVDKTERRSPADDWLPADWRLPSEGFSLDEAINRLIERALQQTDQNVSAAARLLGVTRDYVRYRLKQRRS